MNKSSFTLSPGWHIPAALVLTFAGASPFMSMAIPRANELRAQGHADIAVYFTVLAVAVWFIALVLLLPRRHNTSGITFVRALGRLPLLVRYFLAFGLAIGLFWLGILYERLAA